MGEQGKEVLGLEFEVLGRACGVGVWAVGEGGGFDGEGG